MEAKIQMDLLEAARVFQGSTLPERLACFYLLSRQRAKVQSKDKELTPTKWNLSVFLVIYSRTGAK